MLFRSNVYGWTGWQVALAVGLRTVAVGLVSMLFAYTTEPADLGRALVHRLHLPRRFVYGALAAIQFLTSAGTGSQRRMTERRSAASASLMPPARSAGAIGRDNRDSSARISAASA